VVCGSNARGESDELSDLDLWAIVGEPWGQFAFLLVHDVAVDLSVMSAYEVGRETGRNEFYRNVAADAAIAIDRDGTFAALRDRLLANARETGERTTSWCRLRPQAVIRDAASAVRNRDPDAGLLLDAALLEIVASPGTLAGNGSRRPVRALAAVRRGLPGVAELIDAFHARALEERPAILERLAELVLAEVGCPVGRYRSRRRWVL